MAQEYGRYYGFKVGVFRGGCLTGPQHGAVELHGYLSYLVKAAVNGIPYTVFGYKEKQVRDNIPSKDVVTLIDKFLQEPKRGEVYNLGGGREGGRENSVSVLEVIEMDQELTEESCIECISRQTESAITFAISQTCAS